MTPEDRWQTIRDLWRSHQWLYVFAGICIGVLLFPAFDYLIEDFAGFLRGFVSQAMGIVVAVLLLDYALRTREDARKVRNFQEQLVREAGSPVNAVAKHAIHVLAKNQWLGRQGEHIGETFNDPLALLRGVDFARADLQKLDLKFIDFGAANFLDANLSEANLRKANLQNANLQHARMEETKFWETNLQDANLRGAKLYDCIFSGVNLKNANLPRAHLRKGYIGLSDATGATFEHTDLKNAFLDATNFTGANFKEADFTNAYMRELNFSGANLSKAIFKGVFVRKPLQFDTSTILPDGTYWTPERDLLEFGAETRKVVVDWSFADEYENLIDEVTFADGAQRLWYSNSGWKDDIQDRRANLSKRELRWVTLTNTDMHEVNFSESDMRQTRLRGTNLRNANLTGSLFGEKTEIDETTILPDGTNWTAERDLREFGIEPRRVIEEVDEKDLNGGYFTRLTFEDGTQRRWKWGEGWLD